MRWLEKVARLSLVAAVVAAAALAAGCSTARQVPVPADEAGVDDGALRFPDGQNLEDVWIPEGDGFTTGGIKVGGEICGGGEVASGGGLVLQGQLGHAFDTRPTTGGGTSLQLNSALLP
jgi:hypothetical protein